MERFDVIDNKSAALDSMNDAISRLEGKLENVIVSVNMAEEKINALEAEAKRSDATTQWLTNAVMHLQSENIQLREGILDLKVRQMQQNLIFNGVTQLKKSESREECTAELRRVLKDTFRLSDEKVAAVKIGRIHRIFPKNTRTEFQQRPYPLIVHFVEPEHKEWILQNTKNLRGQNQISVSEQFPKEIDQVRRNLWPIRKKARMDGKKVVMSRDKLIIDGEVYHGSEAKRPYTEMKFPEPP